MDTEFWIQRWQVNKIGFHLDQVNPLLLQYFPVLDISPPARVFVPLCGKSVDMVWLRAQGYKVIAVEISSIAVANFFREQQLSPVIDHIDDMQLWQADGIAVWCADFFALRPEHLGDVTAVYDRAALIAMPATMRAKYARHLISLCPGAPQLLITLEYPQSQMAGPPFSVTSAEVLNLYGALYTGAERPIASVDVLPSHDHFAARGLTALYEHVYLLQVPKK